MPEPQPAPEPAVPVADDPSAKPLSPRGRCLARLVTMLVAPVLFLLLLEGLLRVAGVGYPTSFWVKNHGGEGLTTNMRFGWRYFPPRVSRWPRPQVVQPQKPENSLRVLVLGESAAFGTPSELYGFPRVMQLQLEQLFPDRKVEVINGAMTAINSHAIVDIARDSAKKIKPDWVVIYMGNNEVVGPFGGGSVFGHFTKSRGLIRATLALQSTAIAQGFNAILDPAGTQGGKFEKWEGMANFVDQQMPAWDPRMPTIYEHFAKNLQEIIAVSQKGGAKVLLCTVPVNLRDFPPFASQHGPDFDAAKKPEFDRLMAAGEQALDAGEYITAWNRFNDARWMDRSYALSTWLLANVQAYDDDLANGFGQTFMQEALDMDALRFRCDESLQEIILQTGGSASDNKILAVNIRKLTSKRNGKPRLADPPYLLNLFAMANAAAPGYVEAAGNEIFHEHVHLNFHGNYLVGSQIADTLHKLESGAANDSVPKTLLEGITPPVSEELTAQILGYTPLEVVRVKGSMVEGLLAQPPFTLQWRHEQRYAETLAKWQAEKHGLLQRESILNSLQEIERSLAERPQDLHVRESALWQYAKFDNLTPQAEAQARFMVQRIPGNYIIRTQLADLLQKQGKLEEAKREYELALEANPYYHVAINNLEVLEGEMERRRYE